MIKHAWSLMCTKCITDPDTKNVTLTEVVEQLNVPPNVTFPATAPFQTDFVSTWYREDADRAERATGRVVVHGPDGNSREAVQFAIDLTAFYRVHTIIRSAGLELVSTGVYYFVVECRAEGQQQWETVARLPLNVVRLEVSTTATTTTATPAPVN